MKKLLNLFVLPLLAGVVICSALHTLIPCVSKENIDMLGDNTNVAFGVLGFLFGFLPVFIRNLAVVTLQDLREPVSQVEDQCEFNQDRNILEVGQIFAGTNCIIRVKSVKAPLFANADFTNYQYALNFSI